VVEKLASFPKAAANSFSVSSADGALATKLLTAVETNAVVAICVVFVPAVAVGASGVPVNVGDAFAAYVVEAFVVVKYVLEALVIVKYVDAAVADVKYVDAAEAVVKYEDRSIIAHEAVVPLVVRYLPLLPVCVGRPVIDTVPPKVTGVPLIVIGLFVM